MGSNYLIKFLEEKDVPTVTKKRHTYLGSSSINVGKFI